jgi:hypothetical protein
MLIEPRVAHKWKCRALSDSQRVIEIYCSLWFSRAWAALADVLWMVGWFWMVFFVAFCVAQIPLNRYTEWQSASWRINA